jgi:hypothetical protein
MSTIVHSTDLLDRIGDVPSRYVHHDRRVEPRDPLIGSTSILKWYNVYDLADVVPDGLESMSRSKTRELLESGVVQPEYGMGLVILHHSSANDFLMVGGWRGHQEYWHSVFLRAANSNEPWVQVELGAFAPIMCVWEMSPVWHERNSWVTYLKSGRTLEDRQSWLDDRMSAVL